MLAVMGVGITAAYVQNHKPDSVFARQLHLVVCNGLGLQLLRHIINLAKEQWLQADVDAAACGFLSAIALWICGHLTCRCDSKKPVQLCCNACVDP